MNGILGIPFIAFAPFVGVAIGVYLFGKISMAHFNPAVTLGYLITKHITKIQLAYYFVAEIIGALLGSLFVKYVIGNNTNLGANVPNYSFPIPIIFGIEVLTSALLMAVILVVVYTGRIKRFERTCHRWHCWSEYFLFVLYLRRFYESSAFFSTRFTDGHIK